MAKNEMNQKVKRSKKRSRLSFKVILIGIIIALLLLLTWDGLQFGKGNGQNQTDTTENGTTVESTNVENTKEIPSQTVETTDGTIVDLATAPIFVIHIKEETITVEEDGSLTTMTIEGLKTKLMALKDVTIVIYDDAANNRLYEEVIALVDETGLAKVEDIANP